MLEGMAGLILKEKSSGKEWSTTRGGLALKNWHVRKQSSFMLRTRAFMGCDDKIVWHGVTSLCQNITYFKQLHL